MIKRPTLAAEVDEVLAGNHPIPMADEARR
jgi:hypothetical protein